MPLDDSQRNGVRLQMVVKVGPFCRKGHCSLLQPATHSMLLRAHRLAVERTSALVVRLAAKVPLGKLILTRKKLQVRAQFTKLLSEHQ